MSEFIEFVREKLNEISNKYQTSEHKRQKIFISDVAGDIDNLDTFLFIVVQLLDRLGIDFKSIIPTCINLLDTKANDYSNKKDRYSCFERTFVLARYCGSTSKEIDDVFINDFCQKIARIENLLQNNIDPKNESLIDSFIDLINYRLLFEGYKMGLQ